MCKMYRVSTKEHYTFKMITENKCGILRTSHLHQSIEKLSFVHTSHRLDMCSASHKADVDTMIQLAL
jgi:hypothetical protein